MRRRGRTLGYLGLLLWFGVPVLLMTGTLQLSAFSSAALIVLALSFMALLWSIDRIEGSSARPPEPPVPPPDPFPEWPPPWYRPHQGP